MFYFHQQSGMELNEELPPDMIQSPEFKTGPSFLQYLITRLPLEWRLFKERICFFVLFFIVDYWLAVIVFRNLAFYRYRVGERLVDLGFEILPEYSSTITNLPLYLIIGVTILITVLPYFTRKERAPFTVNMVFRTFAIITLGHILRMLTYITTSLPGSADYCLSSNPHIQEDKPKTLFQILFHPKIDTGRIEGGQYNCGDLTYSGHLVSVFACAFAILRYTPKQFKMDARVWWLVRIVVWGSVLLQCVLIIMARHHYTIDVVVACYVMPLLNSWYDHKFPKDRLQ